MNKLFNNKKGMFFTLMAMLLIGLFIFALTTPPKNLTGYERIEPVLTRIQGLNDLVTSVNQIYVDSIVTTTTFNMLKNISEDILRGASPTDFDTTFKLGLEDYNLGSNISVHYWFDKLNKSANEAYHTTFDVTHFEVLDLTQQDGDVYSVSVRYNINYSVNIKDKDLYWKVGKKEEVTKVSIIGMPDPDNVGREIVPIELGGEYDFDVEGISFLEKFGGSTMYPSNKICPSLSPAICGN